jgi:hypothetical protein
MGVLLMAGFVGLSTSDRILTSFVSGREPKHTPRMLLSLSKTIIDETTQAWRYWHNH